MHVGWRVIILRRYLITHASSKDLCNFIESLTLKYFTLTVTVKLSTNITWSDVLFFLNKVSRPFSLKGNVTMLQLLLKFSFRLFPGFILSRSTWQLKNNAILAFDLESEMLFNGLMISKPKKRKLSIYRF